VRKSVTAHPLRRLKGYNVESPYTEKPRSSRSTVLNGKGFNFASISLAPNYPGKYLLLSDSIVVDRRPLCLHNYQLPSGAGPLTR
jgi:hypothetical protein